ncbi:MAG: pur operon repressor [Bacillota bacterium]
MRLKRGERVAIITKVLSDRPSKSFPLSWFQEMLGAAKSTLSEDLTVIKRAFEHFALGRIDSQQGVGGGVTYRPSRSPSYIREVLEDLCTLLQTPDRILPGGFLYMTDILFSPWWTSRLGEIFAAMFVNREPKFVVTMETKGIPVALMTAKYLDVPLVLLRRDHAVTEGSVVSINYVSGSSGRIQTMSLPKRALPRGAKVLLIDDFMKAGGTARGMLDIMAEFDAEVAGVGILIETKDPEKKLIVDYVSLIQLESISEHARTVSIHPSPRLTILKNPVD